MTADYDHSLLTNISTLLHPYEPRLMALLITMANGCMVEKLVILDTTRWQKEVPRSWDPVKSDLTAPSQMSQSNPLNQTSQ